MDFLAKDLADLAVPLLRAACDLAVQTARGMPYASQIRACAAAVVEERQRAVDRVISPKRLDEMASLDEKCAERAREQNIKLANQENDDGKRFTPALEVFHMGAPGELRGVRLDGTVIFPRFDQDKREWTVARDDIDALTACYRNYNAAFRLRGYVVEATEA